MFAQQNSQTFLPFFTFSFEDFFPFFFAPFFAAAFFLAITSPHSASFSFLDCEIYKLVEIMNAANAKAWTPVHKRQIVFSRNSAISK